MALEEARALVVGDSSCLIENRGRPELEEGGQIQNFQWIKTKLPHDNNVEVP